MSDIKFGLGAMAIAFESGARLGAVEIWSGSSFGSGAKHAKQGETCRNMQNAQRHANTQNHAKHVETVRNMQYLQSMQEHAKHAKSTETCKTGRNVQTPRNQ